MPKFQLVVLLATVLAIAGCARSTLMRSDILSPLELNTNPQRYHGQVILVRGYVTLVPEGHNLYQSRKLAIEFDNRWGTGDPKFDARDYFAYCLTIANPHALMPARRALHRATITVKGTFLADYLGERDIDFGACPLNTGIVIDTDDLKRRYPSIFAN
ncbi:MAG TPA: hypothetical protein VJ724_02595 [Tahibacter sp.]|nr:hypothetical protein [Tahibacter sp.]